ncbi:hypothetical protein LWI28_013627 [Acer negundo]|uniref:RNase H type-1 domain-containing protein n=1 Tax=Acer negundo TaxID=4023 RepID=A0AAD5IE11_ACENE|nr:hypothetical protein LWI28_013627 [Acer negundo]
MLADSHLIGIGMVVRDSNGSIYAFSISRNKACFSLSVAQATSILLGLRLPVDDGLLPAVLESDTNGWWI